MAINAGYWDIHVYVHWNKTRSMAEITLLTRDDGCDEIRYGPVLRSYRKAWRKAASWKKRNLEAPGGIEPPIRVLRTLALPLGDGALVLCKTCRESAPKTQNPPARHSGGGSKTSQG